MRKFVASLVRGAPGVGTLEAGPRPVITGGTPPEFGGTPDVWSPEHLLVSATALCFMTTFEWFAKRDQLPIEGFRCEAEGIVDKTPAGLAFTSLRLDVTLTVPAGERERARGLVSSAKRSCLISNSLRPIVEVAADIVEAEGAARSAS
jgi:organic hydroperoxide reductase OsmC/OhrA